MRIALAQTPPAIPKERADLSAGLERLRTLLAEAKRAGADLLVTPEMMLSGYNIGSEAVSACAESAEGPAMAALRALAQDAAMALCVGLPVRSGERVHNAAVFIDETGAVRDLYRKTHLFGSVDRSQFAAGDQLPRVFSWRGWRLAMAICYDIEFPEVARHCALAATDILLVPTANMDPHRSVPRRIVPVRAEENAIFVVYVNYVGREDPFTYHGLSCVCGPDGEDLVRAGTEPAMVAVTLDRAALAAARSAVNHLADRRADLFAVNLTTNSSSAS